MTTETVFAFSPTCGWRGPESELVDGKCPTDGSDVKIGTRYETASWQAEWQEEAKTQPTAPEVDIQVGADSDA